MADRVMTITIEDFLKPSEVAMALAIWRRNQTPAKEICEKIIKPNMARVNTKLGQENDPLYLAYAVEHTFNCTERR